MDIQSGLEIYTDDLQKWHAVIRTEDGVELFRTPRGYESLVKLEIALMSVAKAILDGFHFELTVARAGEQCAFKAFSPPDGHTLGDLSRFASERERPTKQLKEARRI